MDIAIATNMRDDKCPHHGEFISEMIFGRWTGCPACIDLRMRESKAAMRREQADGARNAFITGLLAAAQIPAKFSEARLADVDHRAAVQTWLQGVEGGDSGSLIVLGPVGTGKTYLACALARAAAEQGIAVRYETVGRYLRALKDTWGNRERTEASVFDPLARVRLLVLDEIGVCSDADTLRVHELIAERYDRALPTVFISNLNTTGKDGTNPLRMHLGDRAYDRMREGNTQINLIGASRRKGKAHAA